MFRRTSVQVLNKGGMWDESFRIYPLLRAESNITRLEWTFPPHNNRIRFGHMEHEKTRFDWQGAQIPYIAWDELTHFTEEQFFYILSRNRSTCGVRPYSGLGCGTSHSGCIRCFGPSRTSRDSNGRFRPTTTGFASATWSTRRPASTGRARRFPTSPGMN